MCVCSGNETYSLFVTPESCEENYHEHHSHTNNGNIPSACEPGCESQISECGCQAPEVKYFRLVNQLINDEIKYVKSFSTPFVANLSDFCLQINSLHQNTEEECFYSNPPPQIKSGIDFLIQIHQLKIPDIA
jgi:hypothetical protein